MVTKPQLDTIKDLKNQGFQPSDSNEENKNLGGPVEMEKNNPPPAEKVQIEGDGSVVPIPAEDKK
jgi:hypothetical protein